MRHLIAAAAVTMALPLFWAAPARAQTYPWCSVYNPRGDVQNCGFSTYQQCMANVSGIGGYCMRNPLYPERRPDRRSTRDPDRR